MILFGIVATPRAAEYQRSTTAGLADSMPRLKPDDQIVVTAGRYPDWEISIVAKGAAEKPIVIRPAAPGKVIFTGKTRLEITGGEHGRRSRFTDGLHRLS